jgi:hypothetical protein
MNRIVLALLGVFFCGELVLADTVTVDWTTAKKAINPLAFGMDAPFSVTQFQDEDTSYISGLKYMTGTSMGNTGLIRLHQWGMLTSWTTNAWWDSAKVMRTIRPLNANGFTFVVNIPDGPGGQFSTIDTNQIGKFCTDLVTIINVDHKSKVKYFEVPNERDVNAFPGMLDAAPLADLVKRCRASMKNVDSTILVGGPAFGDAPNLDLMLRFVRAIVPNIDFLSFHAYAVGGTPNAPDSAIYNSTQTKIARIVKTLRDTLSVLSPNKYIPIHCNEYNLTWDWNYIDARLHTNKMAVYVALVMIEMVRNGGDITSIWNEKEPAFGMMSPTNQPYLPGQLFHLMNKYFMGEMVASTETNRNTVVAFASGDTATRSLALINRSPVQRNVALTLTGLPTDMVMTRHQIWTDGYPTPTTITVSDLSKGINLPDNSVTILTGNIPVHAIERSGSGAGIGMKPGPVRLSVYTISGRLMGTLSAVDGKMDVASLSKTIRFGFAKAIPSGVYIVVFHEGSFTHVQQFKYWNSNL